MWSGREGGWRSQTRDALEGRGPQRRSHMRLDRRMEEVAKAVAGGYCRLQMPLKLAVAVRGTAAGHRLSALEGDGCPPPPLPMHPWVRQNIPLVHCTFPPAGVWGVGGSTQVTRAPMVSASFLLYPLRHPTPPSVAPPPDGATLPLRDQAIA